VTRPNILFVLVDQLSAAWLSAYGHEITRTPSIDRLAESGVVFENCYCNGPMCVPSRASMFSGRFVSDIDALDNGCELPARTPTFVHHLRAAGYRTSLAGKAHFIGPDQLHGFENRLNAEIYPSSFRWTPAWDDGVSLNPGSNVAQVQQSGICLWNLQMKYDEETCFRALEHLRSEARRMEDEPDTPFFLNVSFTHPHDPFFTTSDWWNLYAEQDIPSPTVPRNDQLLHQYDRWLQVHHGVDKYTLTDEHIHNARRAYFSMCSYADSLIGKVLDEVERLNLREKTVVIFSSDHGEMLGEHGMWFKRTYFEESTRVPLIFSWPGTLSSGRRAEAVVSLVDLFPTFCGLGNAEDNLQLQGPLAGESLQGLLSPGGLEWKDEAIIEYCGEGVEAPMRALRRGKYKLVDVPGTALQLFDLTNDPHEMRNVVSEPELASVVDPMLRRLQELWDPDELRARIIASQRQRRVINSAVSHGVAPSWDYDPALDPSRQYVRTDAQEASRIARFPQTGGLG
jgi:choline-sulfatase